MKSMAKILEIGIFALLTLMFFVQAISSYIRFLENFGFLFADMIFFVAALTVSLWIYWFLCQVELGNTANVRHIWAYLPFGLVLAWFFYLVVLYPHQLDSRFGNLSFILLQFVVASFFISGRRIRYILLLGGQK